MHCEHSRFVWNLALEQANWYDPAKGPTPNSAERMRQLTEARAHSEWLASGSTVVQQGALRDFDRALANWWGGLRKKRAGSTSLAHGRPTWRRRGIHEGFVVRDLSVRGINRRWAEVVIPKAGWVRFRLTGAWHEIKACTSARVTRDRAGRWHVSLTCPPPPFERATTGAVVGIDRGVANSIATSDSAFANAPAWTDGEQRRFLALARQLSRQKKGSNRRARTVKGLAKLHAKLGDRRRDWI
jgi:transposase